jgi:hypothetical protein
MKSFSLTQGGTFYKSICFLLFLLLLPSVVFAEWTIEELESPKLFDNFFNRSLAIDKVTNQPHIVYGGSNLYHAYFDGAQWRYETADSTGEVGDYASIAIDSNNKVHISYSGHRALKYATNASGEWVISTIETSINEGQYTSIAIDTNNKVHISYCSNYDLKYATNASGVWVISQVDTIGKVQYTSIALDTGNKAHISYHSGDPNYDLKYATNASGSWVKYTIDSTGDTGEYASIALDTNNKAHISYYDGTNGALKYATNASGSWVVYTIDSTSTGFTGLYTSIALDTNNKAHISYHSQHYQFPAFVDLKYATNASGEWVISTIDSAGDVGKYSSIALDANNKAHISYFGGYPESLKYATNASGSWIISAIDSQYALESRTSMALDTNNKAHISYLGGYPNSVINTDYDLRYATNASGSWVISTIDSAAMVTHSSIALDTNNKAHISYYDDTNDDLRYATNASGEWVISIIDSDGDVGKYSSIALDINNKAHISYSDGTNGDLRYATNASGGWVISTIDSAGRVGEFSSIAVDTNNKAHISYSDGYPNYDLKYATNASGGWVISTIDSTGNTGLYTSIALDTNNNAHISCYVSNPDYDLRYATNASGSWVISTIDSTGNTGLYTSIALDTNNNAHISYYDYTNDDLRYATNASGTWVTSTIDSSGDVGWWPSIAINTYNKAHISYTSYTGDNHGNYYSLKYATNYHPESLPDDDGDGYPVGEDCDDNDPLEHPDQTWYVDADNDGYSEGTVNNSSCERPLGYKAASELQDISGDCDDNDPALNPSTLWYPDSDGDGFGNPAVSLQQCTQPEVYVLNSTDCDDYDADIYYGSLPVRITGMPSIYYSTIQSAYDDAPDLETVQIKGNASEVLNFNLNKSVVLDGGYACSFATKTGRTIVYGIISIGDGLVTIGDFEIQ